MDGHVVWHAFLVFLLTVTEASATTIDKYMHRVRHTLLLMEVPLVPAFNLALTTALKRLKEFPRQQHFKQPLTPAMISSALGDTSRPLVVRTALAVMWCCGLRVSECVYSHRAIDPSVADLVMRCGDVTFTPSGDGFALRLRHGKSDPCNTGFTVHVAANRAHPAVCPVVLMRAHLATRSTWGAQGPLFAFADGRMLTRADIDAIVKAVAIRFGRSPAEFSTHSVRIGGATTLATAGASLPTLLSWGRWQSTESMARYTRLSPDRAAIVAAALALPVA